MAISISGDAGETFSQPIAVDDGSPAGRVDLLLFEDGSALVCWLEKLPEGGAVRVRRVRLNGKSGVYQAGVFLFVGENHAGSREIFHDAPSPRGQTALFQRLLDGTVIAL